MPARAVISWFIALLSTFWPFLSTTVSIRLHRYYLSIKRPTALPFFFWPLPHTHLDFSYVLHDLSHVQLPIRPYQVSQIIYVWTCSWYLAPTGAFLFWIDDFHFYRLLIQTFSVPCKQKFVCCCGVTVIQSCCTDGRYGEAWLIYTSHNSPYIKACACVSLQVVGPSKARTI